MEKVVAVALSGGVDSMTAAAILKRDGYKVIGIHFQTGYQEGKRPFKLTTKAHDTEKLLRTAAHKLEIPFFTINCKEIFHSRVVKYFIESYKQGLTPNPCIVCNRDIKFAYLLDRAHELGASLLATGHYVRTKKTSSGTVQLLKGVDRVKDQSYFLSLLTQEQLQRALFPLGGYTKSMVKEMARRWKILPTLTSESQDICFIKDLDYARFISDQCGFKVDPGPIVDLKGRQLGCHKGLHAYTVGQRRKIGIPAPEPYYVVRLESENNRLIVGHKSDLLASECTVKGVNWIEEVPSRSPVIVRTRIRYQHREAESRLTLIDETTVHIRFFRPQLAITPGQCAVFYQDERVIGGGWVT